MKKLYGKILLLVFIFTSQMGYLNAQDFLNADGGQSSGKSYHDTGNGKYQNDDDSSNRRHNGNQKIQKTIKSKRFGGNENPKNEHKFGSKNVILEEKSGNLDTKNSALSKKILFKNAYHMLFGIIRNIS